MLFGLVNISATFQRAMGITFHRLIRQIMVVYLDDVTVFSRRREDHVHHLKKIFERCQRYEISLNPKKSVFTVLEGNLLGHIVAKSGIKVDLDQIVKPMQDMIKKDVVYGWGLQEYDLKIKPVHTIKGYGLYRLAAEVVHASESKEELVGWEQEIEMHDIRQATPTEDRTSWYEDVRQYLEHDTIPSHLSIRQKRAFRLKALAYQLVHGVLYRKHCNGVFLRCLEAHES
eukprot:PITA_28901